MIKTENNSKSLIFKRCFNIILSIMIIISGICLITACVSIYNSGDSPFSREIVAEKFSHICIPVYICLAMTIVSFIWEFLSPDKAQKSKNVMSGKLIVSLLSLKKDMSLVSADVTEKINVLKLSRKILTYLRNTILTFCSIIFLIFTLNAESYGRLDANGSYDINGVVIDMMKVLVPCLIIAFGITIFHYFSCEKSYKTELSLIKDLPALKKEAAVNNAANAYAKHYFKTNNFITVAILIFAMALLLIGFFLGGTSDVLTKAVNICTECIGLG